MLILFAAMAAGLFFLPRVASSLRSGGAAGLAGEAAKQMIRDESLRREFESRLAGSAALSAPGSETLPAATEPAGEIRIRWRAEND
jgi:hypothetical protein